MITRSSITFRKPANLLYIGGLLLLLISIFSNCSRRKSGEQPNVDSVYVKNFMNSRDQFKDDSYWAMEFYKKRSFKLGWFKDHELSPQAEKMLNVVKRAGEDGLDASKYNIIDFEKPLAELKKVKRDLDKRDELERSIDLGLTATYLNWASDFYRGLLEPRDSRKADWDIKRNTMRLDLALEAVLGERESDYAFADFKPTHQEYANLKKALANYRAIEKQGGWPKMPSDARVSVGSASSVVPLLRKRLEALIGKDTVAAAANSNIFTAALSNALKTFQKDNGLKVTGNLNEETLRFMNVPVQDRIRQVVINMERWRWIPQSFGTDYLIVNIPEYRLRVYTNDKEAMSMNVIVGKEMHSTPIFNDLMEHVVISPYWNIPPGILRNEVAPKVQANAGYLEASDMEVINQQGERVDPSSVNWAEAGSGSFPYVVRRRPGPKNDLGRVKFIFPNSRNIYLHDTPATELFNASKRDFSHGCVRVEKPIELAEYLLRNTGWDRSRIEEQVATRQEKYVPLKKKLPVYLVYFTAAADTTGRVRFYNDIYAHDGGMKKMYFAAQ